MSEKENEKEYIIKLLKESERKNVEINYNNVKVLTISDDWKYNLINNEMIIKLDGYIGIEVYRRVKYNEIDKYIYELMTYIQLLRPDKLKVNKITVCVDEVILCVYFAIAGKEYDSVKDYFNDDEKKLIIKAMITIPEFIHLNSFMYEPLMDVGLNNLKKIYNEIYNMGTAYSIDECPKIEKAIKYKL